ncbi:hypothetical protein P154DRAFT_560918 [Amniculicola lignicola CBS 123094]|uniref:BTB domain-containing protein n=1 Tax=Amniculicola lignicola CBS 123094 TaxID=1392246 RepID=A0A6A5WT58_9PLEO|nr:hypothetical protein P154DRAFT_560918 [Amniculicola lignicola CBS 123094]
MALRILEGVNANGVKADLRGIYQLHLYPTTVAKANLRRQKKMDKEGLTEWSELDVLSDVTIRYGYDGEKTFLSHKVILSASSVWFRNAFTGDFVRAAAYDFYRSEDESHDQDGAKDLVLYHLSIYEVADKYNVPHLVAQAADHVSTALQELLRVIKITQYGREAIEEIDSSEPLRKDLVSLLSCQPGFRLFGNAGYFTSTILKLTREIPEFAQDFLLESVEIASVFPRAFYRTLPRGTRPHECNNCRRYQKKEDSTRGWAYCRWCGGPTFESQNDTHCRYWERESRAGSGNESRGETPLAELEG